MKKLADSNGAELAPISVTGGMSAGRGVVSMRVVRLNLRQQLISDYTFPRGDSEYESVPRLSSRHLECIFAGSEEFGQIQLGVCGSRRARPEVKLPQGQTSSDWIS